jgi:2-dehydro-3-deoxyphosphogalactonate aldolase
VAILRGIPAKDALEVGQALIDAGVTVLEVPVRSKADKFAGLDQDAIESIKLFVKNFSAKAHIMAGTVLGADDIRPLRDLGLSFGLSPIFDPKVVAAAVKENMNFVPGIETLSEARHALAAGAHGIKPFPCVEKDAAGALVYRHSPAFIRTLASFVPCPIYPSGGIDWTTAPLYKAAGAAAINAGGELYTPGRLIADIVERAKKFVTALS